MEFKTVLMICLIICSIAAFVITMIRRIAKDDIVDLIGATVGAVLFIVILTLSFLFEDSIVLWALLFGYWTGNAVCVNGDDD